MRRLLERNGILTRLSGGSRKEWAAAFPGCFRHGWNESVMAQHMLAAALLQDVGELPFGVVTERLVSLEDQVYESIVPIAGLSVRGCSPKAAFTAATLCKKENQSYIEGLDLPFLLYLATGVVTDSVRVPDGARAARHLLDGVVDADRMDYVVRDAFHTSGYRADLTALRESFSYVDVDGPVLQDPGPVANFLTARAHLWVNVYMAPRNRFKNLLLRKVIQAVNVHGDCQKILWGRRTPFRLLHEEFYELDDGEVYSRLCELNAAASKRRLLPNQAQRALRILTSDEVDYESFWVPPPQAAVNDAAIDLPDDLFFDTYSDYRERPLYREHSVRIQSRSYDYLGKTIPLEQCSGPFNALLTGAWSALPMPDSILVFKPRDPKPKSPWLRVDQALREGNLHATLRRHDPHRMLTVPFDTRDRADFRAPDIFVSFASADIDVVRLILEALHSLKRKYRVFAGDYQGVGYATTDNSRRGVADAGGVIVLASRDYVGRYVSEPDGNIAAEINELGRLPDKPRVFLSLDAHTDLQGKLPFKTLGYAGVPFVGRPLRGAGIEQVRDAVAEALSEIDRAAGKR